MLPVRDSVRWSLVQFFFRVLAEELLEQHLERRRKRRDDWTTAGLDQLVLLEFVGTAFRLGVDGLLFAGKAHRFH
jgi:hypothetical protein